MANLSKIKREKMIAYLEQLKSFHSDDQSIIALNEIENSLKEKKFGLIFEEHDEEVDRMLVDNLPIFTAEEDKTIIKDSNNPLNFLIEGDNLQALYLLQKTHFHAVDVIYIDPPYNTGAHDWKYNNDYVDDTDEYKHSKWLSFMKRRLALAKTLLKPSKSVLICSIDEKEYLHLGCLLEDMFPNCSIQMISTMIKSGTSMRQYEFSRCNEYIYYVRVGDAVIEKEIPEESSDKIPWRPLMRSGTGSNNFRPARPNSFYPIYVDKKTNRMVKVGDSLPLDQHPNESLDIEGCITLWPYNSRGDEMVWGTSAETLRSYFQNGYARITKSGKKHVVQYITTGVIADITNGKLVVDGVDEWGGISGKYVLGKAQMPQNQWDIPSHNATQYGTNLLKLFLGKRSRFTFPKSLYAVRDCLLHVIKNNKNAVVLDFFAGSATTMHAVHLMNKMDGGHRKCILVTNNEVSEEEAKELTSKGYKQGDPEWEALGIARYVAYPRIACSIQGKDVDNKRISGFYLDTNIEIGDGFKENIKYIKCDWIERKPEDFLLSNALCMHIKEMIEVKYFTQVDNVSTVLVLNKQDYKNYLVNGNSQAVKSVWVNQNIIFNADEMKVLKQFNYRFVPKEFFGDELREAGE